MVYTLRHGSPGQPSAFQKKRRLLLGVGGLLLVAVVCASAGVYFFGSSPQLVDASSNIKETPSTSGSRRSLSQKGGSTIQAINNTMSASGVLLPFQQLIHKALERPLITAAIVAAVLAVISLIVVLSIILNRPAVNPARVNSSSSETIPVNTNSPNLAAIIGGSVSGFVLISLVALAIWIKRSGKWSYISYHMCHYAPKDFEWYRFYESPGGRSWNADIKYDSLTMATNLISQNLNLVATAALCFPYLESGKMVEVKITRMPSLDEQATALHADDPIHMYLLNGTKDVKPVSPQPPALPKKLVDSFDFYRSFTNLNGIPCSKTPILTDENNNILTGKCPPNSSYIIRPLSHLSDAADAEGLKKINEDINAMARQIWVARGSPMTSYVNLGASEMQ